MSLFGSFWKKELAGSSQGGWQVGERFNIGYSHYEVRQILGGEGKSGMGTVYICYDFEYKFLWALKTIQDKYHLSEKYQRLFEREAYLWIHLGEHSNIVRAHMVQKKKERVFIFLEYIPPDPQGKNTLTHYLGNLTFSEILTFSIQFCYGMEYAYSKGIDAHRDIKPDNIMITADKTVKITDFGLSKAFQEIKFNEDIVSSKEETPSFSIFRSKGKNICGSLPWMAPEQFDGYADKRSDIYAFGIVLYQMTANRRLPPFMGKTYTEYERWHKYEKISAISSPLFPLIKKCLEKEPDKRHQNFSFIREELQNLLLRETGEPIVFPQLKKSEPCDELLNEGRALEALEKYDEAIMLYDRALAIDPRHTLILYKKGFSLYQLKRLREAVICFDKALGVDPQYALTWQYKGMTLCDLGRYEEAIACFDRAKEIEPMHSPIYAGKINALLLLGRFDEALACVNDAMEIIRNDNKLHLIKQLLLRKLGR